MTAALRQPLEPALFLTAALYKFVDLPDCAGLKDPLQAACDAAGVKGTLLLAPEGINGTISGPQAGVRAVLAHLRADPRLADLVHKESWASDLPFLRMKVRLKKEIVTLGVPGVSPTVMAGTYVKPQDWNALISRAGMVVIDTRNDYEVDIGSFKGAVDPRIKTFADLPAWVAAQEQLATENLGEGAGGALHPQGGQKPAVAMFCTGGIRCEKSTAYLRQKGYQEVYHLEGGILKYLEEVPPEQSLWQGECFVFDERVSVGHGLKPGPYELCRSCRHPVGDPERASPLFVRGVSCPRCADTRSPAEKQALAERQRQVELARQRGLAHVGAKMPDKPRHLRQPVEHLLGMLQHSPLSAKLPGGQRILIALAGLPGSGKTMVANKLAQEVNVKMGAEVALALGMDGFHLTRAQLAAFPDPAAALTRRGAPWTFDPAALARRLKQLKQAGQPGSWPGFEHGAGDPVEDATRVSSTVQIIIVEGLYLLHEDDDKQDGWNRGPDWQGLFDERWYLDVPMHLAMERLVRRHMAANGNTREEAERRLAVNDRLNAAIVRASRQRAQWLLEN
jgi:UPF0176 protein